MMSDPNYAALVRDLILDAVPERRDEIHTLWNRYEPIVSPIKSRPGFTVETLRSIELDPKIFHIAWLMGFSGWRAIETYAPHVVGVTTTGLTLEDVFKLDEELGSFELDYKTRAEAARILIKAAEDVNLETWPPDIPMPQSSRNTLPNEQDKVAFDFVCLVLAYIFLHEVRHLMFVAENDIPNERPEEEISCDVWAREFLTVQLASYAAAHGHSFEEVLTKRSMAMVIGVLILHETTPETVHWGTREYPPIVDRVHSLISGTNLPDNSHFWLFAACILTGLIRQTHRPLNITATTYRTLAEKLIFMLG